MQYRMGVFRKFINYLSGARQEVKKINWPTSQEVVRKTVVVILFSTAVTILLGGFDFLFNRAVLNLVASREDAPAVAPTNNLDATNINVEATDGMGEPVEIQVGDEEPVGGDQESEE